MPKTLSPAPVNSRLLIFVLGLACANYAMMLGAITPALPQFEREFNATINATSWIVTAMLLSAAVSAPVIGKLGENYGKKRVLIITMLVFAAGTAVSALAPNLEMMILGRVLQGVGGGLFPLSFSIVRDILPRERIAGAIGSLSATFGIGGGFGMVGAGLVVRYLDSSFLFWIPLIAMVSAMVMLQRFLPTDNDAHPPASINWAGAILLSLALASVLVTISQGRTWGWGSARTLGLFLVAIVSGIFWVRSELRATEPLISIPIMRLRGVWTSNLVGLLTGLGNFGAFFLASQLLQLPESTGIGFGYDALQAGVVMLPAALLILIVGLSIGRLEHRFGARSLNIAGALIATIGFSFLAIAHEQLWQIVLGMFMLGTGIGLVFAAIAGVVVLAVPREHVGPASGMNTVLRTLGSSIGASMTGALLASSAAETGYPTDRAFTLAFWIVAGAVFLGTIASTLIPKPKQSQRAEPAIVGSTVSAEGK